MTGKIFYNSLIPPADHFMHCSSQPQPPFTNPVPGTDSVSSPVLWPMKCKDRLAETKPSRGCQPRDGKPWAKAAVPRATVLCLGTFLFPFLLLLLLPYFCSSVCVCVCTYLHCFF